SPDRHRLLGRRAVLLLRIDIGRLDAAAMAPIVAEIEDVLELRATGEVEPVESRHGAVADLRLELAAAGHVAPSLLELERVQMRVIPAREGEVDGLGKLRERVSRRSDHHPSGRVLELDPAARDQLDPD